MQPTAGATAAFGLLLATLTTPTVSGQPSLPELVKKFDDLRVESASVTIANREVKADHLRVLMKAGSVGIVRAGGETVGFFFHGNGTLEYRSEDPIEFPLVAYNVRKASTLSAEKSEKALSVRDAFTDMLWLSSGAPLPELPGATEETDLTSFFERHQAKFHHLQDTTSSHLLALERMNAPSSPLRIVTFEGGKEDLRYLFDSWESRSESLQVLRTSGSSDPEVKRNLYPSVPSQQAIGRDRRDALPPHFFLTDVRLEVVASEGRDVTLSVAETVVPQQIKQSVLRFALYNVAYDVVGSGSLKPRFFRVREVTDGSGQPLTFHHEHGDLLVGLPGPAEPDRPIKIRFQIDGDFLIRPGGDDFWLLGIEPWFPQPDLGGQFYTLHTVVRVPKPFVPFAPGRTISRREDGAFQVLETETDKPVQGAIVLAGKYDFHEEVRNGLTIRVATYAFKNARAVKQLTDLAALVIDYYQTFLGPFPFSEFNILEINDYGFGQAPPGVMFITKEAFNPLMGEANQLFSGGVNERFAHEIAHQYWGHVVKMPSWEEQWLSEAFAEYSAALFIKQFKGKAAFDSLVSHWKGRASYAADKAPIPLANLVSFPSEPATLFAVRTGLLYDKGAYLLSVLHRQLGDDTFLTFLKSYQKSFQWKFGSTKTVAGLLQFMTKKDYMPFFEANYWGTGMPTN